MSFGGLGLPKKVRLGFGRDRHRPCCPKWATFQCVNTWEYPCDKLASAPMLLSMKQRGKRIGPFLVPHEALGFLGCMGHLPVCVFYVDSDVVNARPKI